MSHHSLIGATARVAGAAAWTPASLGADLYTWNKHTDLPTSGSIDVWTDSGTGIATATASSTARPTAGVEANGLRYALFDGANSYMTFAGNPAGAVANTIDVVGVSICGLIWIGNQALFSPGLYAGAVFGGPAGVQLHSGFTSDEQISLDLRSTAAGSANMQFFMGLNPRGWQGGTSAAPVAAPSAISFASASENISKGQWLPFVLHLPATAEARLMIGSRANVVAQATGVQNLPVSVKYLGTRYSPGLSQIDMMFTGRFSEFFGANAAVMDNATIDTAFAYLDALKPA